MRNLVLLPGITLPIVVGRPKSIAAAEAAMMSPHKQIILAAIRADAHARLKADETAEVESLEELYSIATLAVVQRIVQLPMGAMQLIVQGQERVQIKQLHVTDTGFEVKFQPLPKLTIEAAIAEGSSLETLQALSEAIQSLWREFASLNSDLPEEVLAILLSNQNPAELVYQTYTLLQHSMIEMQAILEQEHLETLLRQAVADLHRKIEVQRLSSEILGKTQEELSQKEREFFLRQQLKHIQQELGETNPDLQELEELRTRSTRAMLPEPVKKQVDRELARLDRIGSDSAEGGVIRTYLDWVLELPWNQAVDDDLDLSNARTILDADHHGLTQVKDRIIEHLATLKLKQTSQPTVNDLTAVGTVLCFAGPPGVGKTSLGRSIARALGRPFERISLGGLHDEAELRGHRRTYIGAMPGRIIQALHRAGAKNPVIMLDELDKVGIDYRGDPASVLLEVLDPQQNAHFRDLYLDLDFDLSHVLFVGTANDLSRVPLPLLDRLEIIELSGYSDSEKLAIAQQYLLPRQIAKAGLPIDAVQLPSETLRLVIHHYTREAGVRHLEQQLGTLCRKVAVRYAEGDCQPVLIHPEQLETWLGPVLFVQDKRQKVPRPGIATGLAWTIAGGDVLFVEAVLLPEGKELTLTGQLGKVMEESARIAYSYVWSHAKELGIDPSLFQANGVHVHVPSGAIPKDGPSAGVTLVSAIASLLTGRPVRTDTAMTGEINLSGDVLPIGGVREKVMAACRMGIQRILLPKQNEKDLADIPDDICKHLEYVFCEQVDQVLDHALLQASPQIESGNGSYCVLSQSN